MIVIWLPFIAFLAKWILKQSGLKVAFFVRYIDHVQTLQIDFASIRKEDILLVSLLNNLCCWRSGDIKTLAMQSFHMWPVKSYMKCGRKNYLTK